MRKWEGKEGRTEEEFQNDDSLCVVRNGAVRPGTERGKRTSSEGPPTGSTR